MSLLNENHIKEKLSNDKLPDFEENIGVEVKPSDDIFPDFEENIGVEEIPSDDKLPDFEENIGVEEIQLDISPNHLPLEFVKQYLRVEHDFDDLEIRIAIASAHSYVKNLLKLPKDEEIEDMELIIPMLALVAYFYENKTVSMKSNEKIDLMFESILGLHRRDIL